MTLSCIFYVFALFLLFCSILYVLSLISETCRYYILMTMVYLSILLAGFFATFGSIVGGGTFALKSLQFCCSWLDYEIEIRGVEKIDKASGSLQKPVVLISNHQSALDLYLMGCVQPKKCTAMIKSSLKYVPFFNLAAYFSDAIFVNRFNRKRAQEAIKEAVAKMHKKCLKIWVFPEGTRNHGYGMLPFKKGAFNVAVEAQIDIIPVVISNYESFYSKTKKYFRSNGKVIAHVMDPISTNGLTQDDVAELCENVRLNMIEVYEKISKEINQKVDSVKKEQ